LGVRGKNITVIGQGHIAHFFYMAFAHFNDIEQHNQKEQKENDKGNQRVDFDPCDAFHVVFNEFEHGFFLFRVIEWCLLVPEQQ